MFTKAIIINNQYVLKDVSEKPTIIIDKSTLECLSDAESHCLGRYYHAVSTHVLLNEIGADLKKDFNKDFSEKRTPEQVVSILSRRMHGLYRFNTDWSTLLGLSLLGEEIPIDGMAPIYLDGTETYVPGEGRGLFFDEQEGRKTLSAWAAGEFSDSDYKMAKQWHSQIKRINLARLQELGSKLKSLKAKSLEEIPMTVENLLNDSKYQFELLQFLISMANVPDEISTAIFDRWIECGMPRIHDFCQYGFYCIRVYLIFHWALFSGFIGTKSTNQIDLNYLYELPFCRIFSSNDKFHIKLAPVVITDQQKFIRGSDLKSDLKRIQQHVDSLREEHRTASCPIPYPPDWDDSFTNQVWRECVMPREEFSGFSEEEKHRVLQWHRRNQQYKIKGEKVHD